MPPTTAQRILNSIKPNLTKTPKGKTQLGSAGYDNIRDDIEKTKHLREGTIQKVPVNPKDIVNKEYVDNSIITNNTLTYYANLSVVSNATETIITTQNVFVQVLVFDTNGVFNNSSPDHTNDHIIITEAGDYKIECCITANSIGGIGATFEFEVQKNNGSSRIGSAHGDRTLAGGGGEAGSITICTTANLAVNDTVELWVKNEDNTQNIIVEDASLSILKVGG